MNTIQAFVLGAVQGLTEFLPVSSSGHLVIFQHLFMIKEPPLTFDVLVHMGTLLAVFVAFREDIIDILRKPFSRITYLLLVGIIPAGLAGFFLAPYIEQAFQSLLVVGVGLIFTGFILKYSEYVSKHSLQLKLSDQMSYRDALAIGCIQALAIVPGISRSGSTIAAGLMTGLDRDFAARYSFLLSIPVILGAGIFELKDVVEEGLVMAELINYSVGFVAAAVFGYLAIRFVMNLVKEGKLSVFSYYVWFIGLITLVMYFV